MTSPLLLQARTRGRWEALDPIWVCSAGEQQLPLLASTQVVCRGRGWLGALWNPTSANPGHSGPLNPLDRISLPKHNLESLPLCCLVPVLSVLSRIPAEHPAEAQLRGVSVG